MTRARALLWLLLVAGCTPTISVLPLSSGYTLGGTGNGVVLLREENLDGHGVPSTWDMYAGELKTRLHSEVNGADYFLTSATAGPAADYYAALPAGYYRMIATTGAGITERWYMLRIRVEPGVVSYAGTIRQLRRGLNPYKNTFKLADDYDAVVARFRELHPELGADVRKALLEMFACGGECVPQAWGENGSP